MLKASSRFGLLTKQCRVLYTTTKLGRYSCRNSCAGKRCELNLYFERVR